MFNADYTNEWCDLTRTIADGEHHMLQLSHDYEQFKRTPLRKGLFLAFQPDGTVGYAQDDNAVFAGVLKMWDPHFGNDTLNPMDLLLGFDVEMCALKTSISRLFTLRYDPESLWLADVYCAVLLTKDGTVRSELTKDPLVLHRSIGRVVRPPLLPHDPYLVLSLRGWG